MDTPHEYLQSEYDGLSAEQVTDNIRRNYNVRLQLQVHSMQMQMQDRRHEHGPEKDLELTQKILVNEAAAIYFDTNETVPHLAGERQTLLLNSAALLLFDRGMVPWELRTAAIDDCIRKYNAIEQQKSQGDTEDPELIGYDEVQEKYAAFANQVEEWKQSARKRSRLAGWALRQFGREA